MSKRKRVDIEMSKKYEIIINVEKLKSDGVKFTYKDIAEKFGVKPQTLSDIIKNAEIIKDKYKNESISGKIKRIKTTKYEKTHAALLQWFTGIRTTRPDIPVSGKMLQVKATEFATEFNELGDDDAVSSGWISRWKIGHEISMKKMSGESAQLRSNDESITSWLNVANAEIISKYEPENIFNLDECGLFWKVMPDRTLAFKHEQVHGGKKSKDRFTVVNIVNMNGDKEPLLVIAKFAKPRCFRNAHIPVKYWANSKAWMTSDLFTKHMQQLNHKFRSQQRHVAMILDRCPAHPQLILSNIKFFFLPPNTTSHTQPLDAGIINAMKCNYRKKIVLRLLASYTCETEFVLNILDALHLLKRAWDEVTPQTIKNCFRHVGLVNVDGVNLDGNVDGVNRDDSNIDGVNRDDSNIDSVNRDGDNVNGDINVNNDGRNRDNAAYNFYAGHDYCDSMYIDGLINGNTIVYNEEIEIETTNETAETEDEDFNTIYQRLQPFYETPIPNSFEDFANFDDGLQTTALITNTEIIQCFSSEVISDGDDDEAEDDDDSEINDPPPTMKEAIAACNVLQKYLTLNKVSNYCIAVSDIRQHIEKEQLPKKQQQMNDYFEIINTTNSSVRTNLQNSVKDGKKKQQSLLQYFK